MDTALLPRCCWVCWTPTLRCGCRPVWLALMQLTGCVFTLDVLGLQRPRTQFLWVALGDALPDLSSLRQGTDEYPDQSATCVLEVNLFQPDTAGWALQGPGISGQSKLKVQGMPEDFSVQWSQNHASFPCGVDVFLSSTTHIVGLPRTTRLLTEEVV
jgi:alpha-D-ribose 1-methylphosphonate 5-triphosphate synthase subunit PhnH